MEDFNFVTHQVSTRIGLYPQLGLLAHPAFEDEARNWVIIEEFAEIIYGLDSSFDDIEDLVHGFFMLELLKALGDLFKVELDELCISDGGMLSDDGEAGQQQKGHIRLSLKQ